MLDMKQFIIKRGLDLAIWTTLVFLIAMISSAFYYRVWSWSDWQEYRYQYRVFPPVFTDLHRGRIHAGQSIEEIIKIAEPELIERFDNCAILSYQRHAFGGLSIVTVNDRAVLAGCRSCNLIRTFFYEMTPEQEKALSTAWKKYSDEQMQQRQAAAKSLRQVPPE